MLEKTYRLKLTAVAALLQARNLVFHRGFNDGDGLKSLVKHLQHLSGLTGANIVSGIVQNVEKLAENVADIGKGKHLLLRFPI